MKDELYGAFGEQFLGTLGPLQVETDIVASILDRERSKAVGKDDALSEGFILRLFAAQGEFLRSGEDEGEAVF